VLAQHSSTADNGSITFWDYDTGTPFQRMEDIPQPGSLEAEAGVFCSTFDATGTRLITGCADKTIKVASIVISDNNSLTMWYRSTRSKLDRHKQSVFEAVPSII
jgi:WD40 repeat protein